MWHSIGFCDLIPFLSPKQQHQRTEGSIYFFINNNYHYHHFNSRFPGEPKLAGCLTGFLSSSSFSRDNLWWEVTSILLSVGCPSVTQPSVSKHWRNSKHWPRPVKVTHWLQHFLIQHWIPFTPADTSTFSDGLKIIPQTFVRWAVVITAISACYQLILFTFYLFS